MYHACCKTQFIKPNSHALKCEHSGYTISYMFRDYFRVLMMALNKSQNIQGIVYHVHILVCEFGLIHAILYISFLRLITQLTHFKILVCHLQQNYNNSSHFINKTMQQNFTVLQSILNVLLSLPSSHSAAPFAVLLGLPTNLSTQFHHLHPMPLNPAYFNPVLTCRSFHIYFLIILQSYWVLSLNIYGLLLHMLVCHLFSYFLFVFSILLNFLALTLKSQSLTTTNL